MSWRALNLALGCTVAVCAVAAPATAEELKCPKCDKTYPRGKFCPDDGGRLQAAGATCPKCGTTYRAGTKFCPEDGSRLSAQAPGDVSHCEAGQVYEYEMIGGGKSLWVVTRRKKDHVWYRIDVYIAATKSTMKGRREVRWPPEQAGRTFGKTASGPEPRVSLETIEIDGLKFECRVTSVGRTRTWMSRKFPGIIKMESDGKVVMELRKVSGGAAATPYELEAVGALKKIVTAQSLFREGDKEGDGKLDYAQNLAELGRAGLIDRDLARGKKGQYRFRSCHGSKAPEYIWMAVARDLTKEGRHFAVNHEGVIYESPRPIRLDPATCRIPPGLQRFRMPPQKAPKPGSKPTNESRAIGMLKSFADAQAVFREGDKEGDDELDYARSVKELADLDLIPKAMGGGLWSGYRFEVCVGKEPEFIWMGIASPTRPGVTGDRYFAINHEGVVYMSRRPIALDRSECKIRGASPVGR